MNKTNIETMRTKRNMTYPNYKNVIDFNARNEWPNVWSKKGESNERALRTLDKVLERAYRKEEDESGSHGGWSKRDSNDINSDHIDND